MKDFQSFIQIIKKKNKSVHLFFSRFDLHIRLFLLPIILLGVLAILGIIILRLHLQIESLQLKRSPIKESFSRYPILQSSYTPDLSATTAIVMDADSKVILYQKNPVIQSSMASTTKVMTALVALNYFKPTDVLTVRRNYVDGSGLHLFAGEQFTFLNLLYAMFLPSANDAAMTVADNYPGGVTSFVAAMNRKAKELHLVHISYADPAGLQDNGDYATVTDLAKLAVIAMQQPLIRQIAGTEYMYISTIDEQNGYQLQNLNELLGYDGDIGLKTGTTEGAGQVLITAKQQGTHLFIIIVMDSSDRYSDTLSLFQLLDNHVNYLTPQEMVSTIGS